MTGRLTNWYDRVGMRVTLTYFIGSVATVTFSRYVIVKRARMSGMRVRIFWRCSLLWGFFLHTTNAMMERKFKSTDTYLCGHVVYGLLVKILNFASPQFDARRWTAAMTVRIYAACPANHRFPRVCNFGHLAVLRNDSRHLVYCTQL